MDKKLLRKKIINKRDNLDKLSKAMSDKLIMKRLMEQEYYKNSKLIFVYLGFGSEINTSEYIEKFICDGKRVCVPKTNIESKTMEAVEIISLEGLQENKYGILEPLKAYQTIDESEIDLIIVPGVAFDLNGGRVGYGGGYYDKFLGRLSRDIIKVALAYKIQIIDKVPMEEHDIRVDYIITD